MSNSTQQKESESSACPLCGSPDIKTFFREEKWRIDTCTQCTNAWTSPAPGDIPYEEQDFHENVCGQIHMPSIDHLPVEWKDSLRSQVALLTRYLPRKARILEVGCGEGILLRELEKAGFSVYGLEPSKSACARLRQQNFQVAEGYFPDALPPEWKHFDCVIMSHVLEHISNPAAIFGAVARIAPNGYFLLVQTHWKGLVPRIRKQKWYAWVEDQHFWHFTPDGLALISKPFGFKEVKREYSSLVHGSKTERRLAFLARLRPEWQDQFHLLLQHQSSAAATAPESA